MNIRLSPAEYTHAAHAGFLRQASNVCRGRHDAYGYDGGGYDIHILGAVGEFVVAKALGLFWGGPGILRGADVGVSLQVRTGVKPTHRLIIHPQDDDDCPFVLVTGSGLNYTIRGWILGVHAKRREWWQEPVKGRAAFFVLQTALHSIETIFEEIHSKTIR